MDFDIKPEQTRWLTRVVDFMNEHIYPAIPAYDAVVLVSPRRAGDERLIAALRPMLGRIDVEHMRQANLSVDRDADKASPAAAAAALAAAVGLRRPLPLAPTAPAGRP